ncbi:MAG: biotin-dependent carboxyltransferase family protein [bacterium]|nr:biotin-dependent carboxyltransferase family protein [bacterium]
MGVGKVEILSESPFCSFQGKLRKGLLKYGFPHSGAMDSVSMRGANYLVGNQEWSTCMELAVSGPKLEFKSNAVIAVTGADIECFLNDQSFPCNKAIVAKSGDQLHFGKFNTGFISYLAIQGGFFINEFLGSCSTLHHLNIGTNISKGLQVEFGESIQFESERHLPNHMKIIQPELLTLRTVSGVDVSEDEDSELYNQEFLVSPNSNRMGIRITAEKPIEIKEKEIISSGILKGTIQLPASGNPIIMTADHQTAGGYPRVASVITHDLDYLAQMPPNSKIRFRKIAVEKAVDLLRKREQKIGLLFD